ncbi:MAG TPA: hypothetical protein VK658_01760 [Chryseolinea sp.]|nr:hypothetical protein [Chryseolinea sp.]
MPELSNIQTFEKLNGTDYKPILDKFVLVLKRIGLWNEEVEKAINDFEWNVDDNGFIYSSMVQLGHFKTKYSDIKVRPLVVVYTPTVDSSFTDNWMTCDLIIEAEDLRNEKYFHKSYDFVEKLTSEMQKEFNQTGTYFTDEAQDGQDFEGLRTKDNSKLWQFDYAVIPLTLKNVYSEIPSTHLIIERGDFLEVYCKERWTKPSR